MTPLAVLAAACAGLGVLALPGGGAVVAGARDRAAEPDAGRRRAGSAGRARPDAPLVLDLVAAVVESGAPPPAAVLAVARLLAEADQPGAAPLADLAAELTGAGPPSRPPTAATGRAGAVTADLEVPLRRCLGLAEETGAPVAALLRSAADELRRRRRRRASLAAARLGVRVVAPLGLCTLPAFALLGVVPVLLSLGRGLLG